MKIFNTIEQFVLRKVKLSSLFAEYYNRTGSKASYKQQPTIYEAQEIKDWKMAVMSATDPDNPRRGDWMRFCKTLRLDNHLSSVIDTRILRVQRSSFKIMNEKGEENEQLKELLERPWYENLVRLVLMKNFQGTTLIEMFDTDSFGELERVTEIPQSNFIPTKGIVVNEEWDTIGTPYKEGKLANYYLQVGNDYELGMFNELAMIVLAKKLGLGSWMSYIQKFGVPPVFVVTDRMDDGRSEELFNMMRDFRSNHFAILQGNEKVEIPNNNNLDGYKSFEALNSFADAQISKRVLGGTATTDQKSFVGAAEVQERVAQDRYEADKLLFKYYFNTHIRHRLAKISSVYSDFTTHILEWDNQETLTTEDYINGIKDLASHFEFDIEEIKARTGLPITGTKQLFPNAEPPIQKKKNEPTSIGLRYTPFAITTPNIYAATWDAAIERLANQIYNSEVKAADLDRDLVLKNYAALNKSAETAYGSDYYKTEKGRAIRENLLRFSAAKSYNLIQRLEVLKSESKDKADFTAKAKKLVNLHNDTWLDTEKQFVSRSTEVILDWEQFQEDKDLYPNLVFRTMMDDAVRDEHQKLEGIVKPVDDVFWLTHTPPLGHKCRCTVEQTMETATPDKETPKIKVAKEFAHTPVRGQIFSNKNTYHQSILNNEKITVHDNTEVMKRYTPFSHAIKVGRNKVFVNDFHDVKDGTLSITAAKKIAKELQEDVYVLSHVENSGKLHLKNPELGIGKANYFADLKTFDTARQTKTRNFIANNINSANKQGCKVAVFDLSQSPEDNYLEIAATKLRGELKGKIKKNIKQIIIIHNDKVLRVMRNEVLKKNFKDYFKFD